MAELKMMQGILALVDIVNFTSQATKLGDKYTADYIEYFQAKLKAISEKHGFTIIKSMGDAVLFFGVSPEGILNIMTDLYHADKPENKFGFISRFRMVAHSGFFQFETDGDKPIDLISPEGIKVFRMEKFAQSWELMVTQNLYQGIKPLLTKKNIEAVRMVLNEPLKGFDSEEWNPPFYKLRILKENFGVSNLLERQMNELENYVQSIPVFGSIYPPVPMEKNFINLSLVCDDDRFLKQLEQCRRRKLNKEAKDDKDSKIKKRHLPKGEWPYHDLDSEEEYNRRSKIDDIDVSTLYETYCSGIIMGLPGAGKTTILRHLAYKEFKANEALQGDEKRVVLFVQCKDVPFYDKWYQERFNVVPAEPASEEALSFMTWSFLFGKKTPGELTPEELVEFQNAEQKVERAFKTGRLVLLVDALDEAQDRDTRERIKQLFFRLHSENNRLYLTSRPSESIHLARDCQANNIPLFKVLSLQMDQVRGVAKLLLSENSPVYKKFDEAIWREEVVVKMAATPLTALLVTAYFQAYEKFDHRFPMYDLLIKFILLKAWENIKTGMFPYKNMDLFFQEIKSPVFFDKYKGTEILYDALASLCFKLFYEDIEGVVQRSITEEVLNSYFISFLQERMYYNYDEKTAKTEAAQWLERFHRDHLLLQAGAGKYVFVHSTFMEFLAAYYLVDRSQKDAAAFPGLVRQCAGQGNFLELETLPIAAGSSLTTGYDVLRHTSALVKEVFDPGGIYRLGLKCLSEVEWLLHKTFALIRMKSMRKTIDDIVDRNRLAVKWVYLYLKDMLLSDDKEQLKNNVGQLENVLKLSRSTFLEEFLDYKEFDKGDSEAAALRIQLLLKMVQQEVVDKWFEKNQRARLTEEGVRIYDNVLQLDTPCYHPDDKNFNYYRDLIGKELTGFFGTANFKHSGSVRACVFLPDGKRAVSASYDNTLKLWDVETGKEIRTYTEHQAFVFSCALTADCHRLISASADNTLKLWDVETGKQIRTYSGHQGSVYSCALTADGRRLLSASEDTTLKLWDVETGKQIRTYSGHQGSVYSCVLTADGRRLLSASDDTTLKLWDVETGKEIRTYSGHQEAVLSCALTADGRRLISASDDTTLKLWDVETGKEIRTFSGHRRSVLSFALTADGRRLISASFDRTLKLWDVETGKQIRTYSGHQGYVTSCALTPDGRRLISASDDKNLKLWDVETGKEIGTYSGHQGVVFSCALTSDGRRLISASYDNTLKLWDVETGKEIRTFSGHQGIVFSCEATADGRRLISASFDRTLKLWDLENGKEIRNYSGHKGYVYSCALTADGRRLISASSDKTLKLWDLETGKEIRTYSGHQGYVLSSALTPDGRSLISASEDTTLKLWDVETGKEIRTFSGHQGWVKSCALTPDGRRLISASDDQTLKLWDVETGKEIRTYSGHQESVNSCALTPDGRRLISASDDNTLKLWDVETGQCLKTLALPWTPRHISISPVQPWKVFTANANGTVTIFEFEELRKKEE